MRFSDLDIDEKMDLESDFVEKYRLQLHYPVATVEGEIMASLTTMDYNFLVEIGAVYSVLDALCLIYEPDYFCHLFYNCFEDRIVINCGTDKESVVVEFIDHSKESLKNLLNETIDKGLVYTTANEMLVASRCSDISTKTFQDYVSSIDDIIHDGKNVSGVIRCSPGLLVELGLYKDINEYKKDICCEDEEPYNIELIYNINSGYTRIIYSRKEVEEDYCFNVLNPGSKEYLLGLLKEGIRDQMGEDELIQLFWLEDKELAKKYWLKRIAHYESEIEKAEIALSNMGYKTPLQNK